MSAIVTSRHVAGGFVPGVAPDRGGGGVARRWRRCHGWSMLPAPLRGAVPSGLAAVVGAGAVRSRIAAQAVPPQRGRRRPDCLAVGASARSLPGRTVGGTGLPAEVLATSSALQPVPPTRR